MGRTWVDAAMADLLAHEHQLLVGLSRSQRDRLAQLLAALVEPFDAGS